MGGWSDFASVGCPFSYEPDDFACLVGQYMLAHLFHVVSFAVGEVITDEFGSLHAEWLEAVALGCQPVGEWEAYLFGI